LGVGKGCSDGGSLIKRKKKNRNGAPSKEKAKKISREKLSPPHQKVTWGGKQEKKS